MSDAKPVQSTLPTNCKLSRKESPKTKVDKAEMPKIPYASAVGSLMYAMVCNVEYECIMDVFTLSPWTACESLYKVTL